MKAIKYPPHLTWLIAHWEWILALFCLPISVALFDDFGLSWDASAHVEYGLRVLNYFRSGFSDLSSLEMGNIRDKGPLFVLTSALIHWLLGLDPLKLWNLLISLLAILTLPPLAGIGRLFGNERVALYSVLALLLMPRFVGHAFVNPKDVPFACLVCWSMFAMTRICHKQNSGIGTIMGCVVAIGLTLSVRAGGIFLFLYMASIGVFWLLQNYQRGLEEPIYREAFRWGIHISIVFVLAWLIMISLWPYAHQDPILNPVRAIQGSRSFSIAYPVLFAGKTYMSDQLPRYYMVWLLAVYTPLNILFLISCGLIGGIIEQLRSWRSPRSLLIFSIQLWVLFPVSYFVIFTPNVYDGIRHVLFILPGLALLAGLGADYLFLQVRKYLGGVHAALAIFIVLFMGAISLFTMHPYQISYFNALAGDPGTIHTRYETDYWVCSYKEGAEWINQRQKETKRRLRVLIAANDLSAPCALRYLDKRIKAHTVFGKTGMPMLPSYFDFYLSTVRYDFNRNFPAAEIVHSIRRNGILLSVIKGHPEEANSG